MDEKSEISGNEITTEALQRACVEALRKWTVELTRRVGLAEARGHGSRLAGESAGDCR